jgi:hypothetical protein
MLGIFKKTLAHPPQELHCPNNPNFPPRSNSSKKATEILQHFQSSHGENAFSVNFDTGNALIAVAHHSPQRLFCGLGDIYCIFTGSLNNLCSLIRQYGLSKGGTNEAMLVVEAYRTLRDRGPYPADQVLKDLEGDYGFLIYDNKTRTVFAASASGSNEKVRLWWGIGGDGSMVISDSLEVMKSGCGKSFAPFPNGCMYHSDLGLMSFDHPTSPMKAMPRIDSEGVLCGANFKVDVHSKVNIIPRVGSEANWAMSTQ